MSDDSDKIEDTIYYSIAFFLLFLGLCTNIILIIACYKAKSLRLHVRFLSIQFLICFIICAFAIFIEIFFLKIMTPDKKLCPLMNFIKIFAAYLRSTSPLCLIINFFLMVKKPQLFKKRKNMLIIIYLLIIWSPSIIFATLNQILVHFMNKEEKFDDNCLITDNAILNVNHITILGLTGIMIITCGVIVYNICKIEVGNEEFLIDKKKSQIKKVIWFMFGILFCAFLTIIIFTTVVFEGAQMFRNFYTFRCLFLFILDYIFIWNKEVKHAVMKMFCLKSGTLSDLTVSSFGGSQSGNNDED